MMAYNVYMTDLANKTFFKFLFGFLAIIALSFFVIYAVDYYSDPTSTAGVAVEECEEGKEGC